MLLELQNGYTYGPVISRRIGSSLGINVLPTNVKTCTFNCLYCHYGWTDHQRMKITDDTKFPDVDEILIGVEETLKNLGENPNYITFSGNGEPTLHPEFDALVDGIINLRDEYLPKTKTAILSNSTRVHRGEIRAALAKLDMRIMKLDNGLEKYFISFNKPAPSINLDSIIEGLSKLEDVTIQALFASGEMGNYINENIAAWVERVVFIKPSFVQLYTLDRDCPSERISPLQKKDLNKIKNLLDSKNVRSHVF